MRTAAVAALLSIVGGLASAEEANPRRSYNEARRAFEKKDFAAAKKGFLAARDGAQGDVELRYRAAFNLGLTLAKEAEGGQGQAALEALKQSAAWFRDAIHLEADADEARVNLEVVLRRIQAIADQLNKGQNSLDARLSRVIEDERALRLRLAELWNRIDAKGAPEAAAAPVAFREEFQSSEMFQRTLLADASTVADLAAEETEKIQSKAEKERTDEERMRLVMLGNMEKYGEVARSHMADARHLLARLQVEKAHDKVLAALEALKRAREQVQDPMAVLRGLAEDQRVTQMQTAALDGFKKKTFKLDIGGAPKAPVWLTGRQLLAQQTDLDSRLLELLERLKAGLQRRSESSPTDKATDRRTQELLDAVGEAIAPLSTSEQAMVRARDALTEENLQPAAKAEGEAMIGLLAALERFSDLRGLIELAYTDQNMAVELLSPSAKSRPVSTDERASLLRDAVEHNHDRLARLERKLRDELLTLAEQAAAAPDGGAPDPNLEGQKQVYEQAEAERRSAMQALEVFSEKLKKRNADLIAPARLCLSHLESLRRLFFSIVEHLKELHESQGKTYDQTAAAQGAKNDADRSAQLGAVAPTEEQHAQLGAQLAEALRRQADEAAKEEKTQGADKKLGDAAAEIDGATAAMQKAAAALKEASSSGATMSVDLADTLNSQKAALAHVQKAIELLSPSEPPKNQKQERNQKQESKQVSNEQAERQLQEIREREAERQREKEKRRRTPPEQVEKDW